MDRLRKRADFLALTKGPAVGRWSTPAFLLLGRARSDLAPARVGFTVTKKIGGAVVRNRLKRRLRALAREVLSLHGQSGLDYVLIGRKPGLDSDYAAMKADLMRGLRKIHTAHPKGDPPCSRVA